MAVAGDYMSAASFLGIAGLIAFFGYDGFMFSVGWLVAYLTVLLVVAEPLRNAGKYTIAVKDTAAIHNFHLTGPGVNKATSVSGKGSFTWNVTLKKGKYTYVCDPHKTVMKHSFTVS